ncbi:class F sortase [Luteococcus sp. Sow4_B9]|uniref:class F sortase n=1 Tax=Luteococcus sp. Sow4_B9 TaxID=3438792 RepID=UPI003F991A4C
MSTTTRWAIRLVAVAASLLLVVPAAQRLWHADDAMPLPGSTWNLPSARTNPRAATPPTSREPRMVFIPELDVAVGFHDTTVTNGWLDLDDSLTTGVHHANGSTLDKGAFLVAAHVNSRNLTLSPFARLWQVRPGTQIWVNDAKGRPHAFVTTALSSHPKQALPRRIFQPDGESRLVLVTCGGKLTVLPDGSRQYADNVIVEALPLP